MSHYTENLIKFLSHEVLIHIYSSPNFVMETCICFIMCICHYLLILEVNNTIRELNVPPLKIKKKESLTDLNTRRSIIRNVVQNHPQLGIDVVYKDNSLFRGQWDTTSKINKILSTSLSEYIRRDLQRRMKPKMQIESGDEEKSSNTNIKNKMEAMYDYILNEPDFQKRLFSDDSSIADQTEVLKLN